jgi:hypothetical protein
MKWPNTTLRFLFLLLLAACGEGGPPSREFDGPAAFRYLEQQVAFGYRIPGSTGHAAEAAWLDSLLRQRADTLVVQRWRHVTQKGDSLALSNFIARFNPAATERVLFLAHCLGRGRCTRCSLTWWATRI